ncbi:hypothetical protein RFI_23396 [Reticulomyxa filosa]|uniref:JmjC domain-containing protein n=1 Tax=Reticulomyxa filosa TaxID=46433 RepID=X6MJZ7_RETFI|nr:hypothetical protein RFI_23396 [Reticulomyxa filosa]|eukprot:ETO13971.1 hypothetical protein RFI_23396 [Reticulomyxa filosa]
MIKVLVLICIILTIISNGNCVNVIEMHKAGKNLHKKVSSSKILSRDRDGDCYFPGFCNINISHCNIDRVPLKDLSYEEFVANYVDKERPVILELNDLSEMLDNSSGIFEWQSMISRVRNKQDFEHLVDLEYKHSTPYERSQTCDIHALEDRKTVVYKEIIDRIYKIPEILEHIDIFNHLIGYLSTVDGSLLGNKWVIFGNTGSGAQFHFDYYLTSFWNLVVTGSKYWLLLSPEVVENVLFPDVSDLHKVIKMPLWQFYLQIYPYLSLVLHDALVAPDNKQLHTLKNKPFDTNIYECLQRPGDILYAPSKFYHSTFNLNATLSVSRNLITYQNFQFVFDFITSLQAMHSEDKKGNNVGMKHAIELCAALFHFNQTMFKQTNCFTKSFLQRLGSFPVQKNGVTNADYYIQALNFAAQAPMFSSFF